MPFSREDSEGAGEANGVSTVSSEQVVGATALARSMTRSFVRTITGGTQNNPHPPPLRPNRNTKKKSALQIQRQMCFMYRSQKGSKSNRTSGTTSTAVSCGLVAVLVELREGSGGCSTRNSGMLWRLLWPRGRQEQPRKWLSCSWTTENRKNKPRSNATNQSRIHSTY